MTTRAIEARIELLKRRMADIKRFDFGAIVGCPSPEVEKFAVSLEQSVDRIFAHGHAKGDQLRLSLVDLRDEGKRPEWLLGGRVAEIDRINMYADRIGTHLDEIASYLGAAIDELEEDRLTRLLSEDEDTSPHSEKKAMHHDVFLSHASEDKADFADEFAEA